MLKIETLNTQLENEKTLVVSWFDYDPFMKLHFERYFFNIIEQINKNDIKKLVLDCSCRRVNPTAADFKEIYELFLSGLATTRLEKMARVCPPDPITSAKYNKLLEKLMEDLDAGFELQNFKSPKEAFNWIKTENEVPEKAHSEKRH